MSVEDNIRQIKETLKTPGISDAQRDALNYRLRELEGMRSVQPTVQSIQTVQTQQQITELEKQASEAQRMATKPDYLLWQYQTFTDPEMVKKLQTEAQSAQAKAELLRNYDKLSKENRIVVDILTSEEMSPFVAIGDKGYSIDLTTAVKAGIDDTKLVKLGIKAVDIAKVKESIKTGKVWQASTAIVGRTRRAEEVQRESATIKLRTFIEPETKVLRVWDAVKSGVSLDIITAAGYDITTSEYDEIKQEITARDKALSTLDKYQVNIPIAEQWSVTDPASLKALPKKNVYLISDYLKANYDQSKPYSGENKVKLDKAIQTLKDAGFDDEQVQKARMQAFVRPDVGIRAKTEEDKPLGWVDLRTLKVEEWNRQLTKDVQKSYQEQKGLAKYGVTLAGGLLLVGTSIVTAPLVISGKIVANPKNAPATVWDMTKGMALHVVSTGYGLVSGKYTVDVQTGNLSNITYDTVMSYLILSGAGKMGKALLSRVTTYVLPRGITPGEIIKETSTGRIPVPKTPETMAKAYAEAMNKIETLATKRGGKLIDEVPIEGTPYKLRYVKSPWNQVVGDTLFHGTKTEVSTSGKVIKESLLDISKKQKGKIVAEDAGIYTDPWAAIGYTRGGQNPGLLMIITDASKVKSGAKGLARGQTQSDIFIRSAEEGFYGSSKTWKGSLETEIVGAKGTKIKVPSPEADLATRALAGDYADFFTNDAGRFVPIKIALDVKRFNPDTVARLKQPSTWYAVKLYSLYSALRTTGEALKHPNLVFKDIAGITKELANLEQFMREGTKKGSVTMPGVRDVYLTEGLGTRIKTLVNSLLDRAFRKTKQQLGENVKPNSTKFREAFNRNLEDSYRDSANALISTFKDVAKSYSASSEARDKFEASYLMEVRTATSAITRNYESTSIVKSSAINDAKTIPTTREIKQSLSEYEKAVSSPSINPKYIKTIEGSTKEIAKTRDITEIKGRGESEDTAIESGVIAEPVLPEPVITKPGRKDYEGAVAWQQGALLRKGKTVPVWKVWSRPYRQSDLETFFEDELPTGVRTVSGIQSATATIQQFRGNIAPLETQQADIGAFVATVHQPTPKPGGTGEIRFIRDIRGEKTDAWKKLALHTTIEQLIEVAFRSPSKLNIRTLEVMGIDEKMTQKVVKGTPAGKIAFAKKELINRLEKVPPDEIAKVIVKTKLTPNEKREILKMLPDRERKQVEVILSGNESKSYAPTRGMPQAEYVSTKSRRKKIKTKKAKSKPMLIGTR